MYRVNNAIKQHGGVAATAAATTCVMALYAAARMDRVSNNIEKSKTQAWRREEM